MMRALAIAATLVASSIVLVLPATGCNEVETRNPPDAAPPRCNEGPFAFPAALGGDQASTPACSSDDNPTNSPAIAKLPRGARYGVDTTVNLVGDRDRQSDCELLIVCKCKVPDTTTPPPVVDAGPDATPAPAPPSTGTPAWVCQ